jgi:hypothetical protein
MTLIRKLVKAHAMLPAINSLAPSQFQSRVYWGALEAGVLILRGKLSLKSLWSKELKLCLSVNPELSTLVLA